MAGIYQTLINATIKGVILIGTILALGIYPGWSLLFFPLGIFSLVLVGTTIGVMITPVGLLYNDVGKSIPLLMQFLMYLTPVVFPIPKSGLAATLFELNPLTPLILNARNWLTGFPLEHICYFLLINMIAIFLLIILWIVYRLAMPILIERMSA